MYIEDEENCTSDFVEVFAGSSTQAANSLGRYCGKQRPGLLRSRGHKMAVKFRSNKRANFKGFKAQYRAGQSVLNIVRMEEAKAPLK